MEDKNVFEVETVETVGTVNQKSEEIIAQYPELQKTRGRVVVCGRTEVREDKNGTPYVQFLLAQRQVISSTPTSAVFDFFAKGNSSKLLRTLQYSTLDKADKIKNGQILPESFNLQRERSLTPYHDDDKEVMNPSTGELMGYYQRDICVEGAPNHDLDIDTKKTLEMGV